MPMYRCTGGGVTPAPITPSNQPVYMISGQIYEPTEAGYAIKDYIEHTPTSNPTQSPVYAGYIYRITGNGGYIIDNYETVTPSSSNPPWLSIGKMYNLSVSGGYLYQSPPTAGAYGTCPDIEGANTGTSFNTGLTSIKRFYIFYNGSKGNANIRCSGQYNYDVSSTNYQGFYNNGSTAGSYIDKPLGTAGTAVYIATLNINGGSVSITTNNNANCAVKSAWWIAIGE